ncbi:MAG: lactonase family protein [Arachnia sp.]
MSELVLTANAADGTISVLALERSPAPRLRPLSTFGAAPGCSTFAVDPERSLVFAAVKGQAGAAILTLGLDWSTGNLDLLARRDVDGPLVYLTLTDDGDALLGASYHAGFGAVWPIDDGQLEEPHSRFDYSNLHSIIQAGRYVYAVSLGEDLIAQFRLDTDQRLVALDPPTAAAPAGSGPRHIVWAGSSAYVVTEFSGDVIRYDVSLGGTLIEAESRFVVDPAAQLGRSRFGASPRQERLIWGADIHLAEGRVFSSERMSSQITNTQLLADGSLGEVLAYSSTPDQPRGFALTADASLVIAVGELSNQAWLLAVDPAGPLIELDRVEIGRGANWVRVVSPAG